VQLVYSLSRRLHNMSALSQHYFLFTVIITVQTGGSPDVQHNARAFDRQGFRSLSADIVNSCTPTETAGRSHNRSFASHTATGIHMARFPFV